MITPDTTRAKQFENGYFSTGSGPDSVLVIGSCRIFPLATYLNYLNTNNRFTINVINIVQFYFEKDGSRGDLNICTQRYESNQNTLRMIKGVKFFIYEPCLLFGMFNTSQMCSKNLFQFGLNPKHCIAIPSFDQHILFQDLVNSYQVIRKKVQQDFSVISKLSDETQKEIRLFGLSQLDRFLKSCHISSFPEFSEKMESDWKLRRWFWTNNHVSNVFSIELFRLINEKFMGINIPQQFWDRAMNEDMYSESRIPLTQYDIDNYGIKWNEPVMQLQA